MRRTASWPPCTAAVVLQTEVVPAQHAVSTTVAPRRRAAEETNDAREVDAATSRMKPQRPGAL